MSLEIEQKYALSDEAAFRQRLAEVGAQSGEPITQSDAYYNHPSRDFGETDEAFRVRTIGGDSLVTYKGPKQGGVAKTRLELELPLADDTADGWDEILRRLGFRPVAVVTKRREPFALERGGRSFELTIDSVEGVGVFAEVETLADDATREAAEGAVLALAEELGLEWAEPRSYLEMLLFQP